ncbi:diacylglycerol/lipid kinase family protein [Sphingomonas oleivorans]|uniref:diacylglycerol/lipid kinase family protein n=1 Tax=Sphingomonas oleivorans TaxID=1735121 RepID=UPI0013FE4D1B|nr:diacylglycerol kinase family protein [Sphingomonas oleivorans]
MTSAATPVIVNRNGGAAIAAGAGLEERIAAVFADAGATADVRLVEGEDVGDAVRACADHALIVVAGGDGTLGAAANALARRGSAARLGILPLGTRNHLARQLGIPLDLPAAANVAIHGMTRRIDLATVNDAGFVNNASVGFYPLLVRWREEERRRHHLPKWLANFLAGWAALRRLPHHRMRLRIEGAVRTVHTPLLFVGNNLYRLRAGHIGERAALDDGKLSLFVVPIRSRPGIIWFALRIMFGRGDPAQDFAAFAECRRFSVSSRSRSIEIALDGEVRRMAMPLRFAILPRALSLMVPPAR